MLENVIAKYRDNKIVTDLGDRRYNVQDKDRYRYFGVTDYAPTVENTLNNINLPRSTTYNIYISSVFDDIDLDIEQRRRVEVRDYICEKSGADNVACVGTINTYLARGAIRDVGKALELPIELIDEAANGVRYLPVSKLMEYADNLPELK